MIPDKIQNLINAHRKVADRLVFVKSLRHLNVSKVATLAGSTYEVVRNSIDLEMEHLLRRRAIKRILIRTKAIKRGNPSDIAENLLKELIWAKYTKDIAIPELSIEETAKIIKKYQVLASTYHLKYGKRISRNHAEDLYDILSFEIERTIYPYYDKDELIVIQYKNLAPLNLVRDPNLPAKYNTIQTYINTIRTVNKFDNAIVKYYMFSNAFGFWKNPTSGDFDIVAAKLTAVLDDITKHLTYQIKNKKRKEFVRLSIPLKILDNAIQSHINDAEEVLSHKQTRDQIIASMCELEYSSVAKKIRKSVISTVIYLFATKIIFALLVEVPYELSFLGHIDYTALGINIIFPPIFMAMIASSFRIPKERNTQAIIQMVDRLMDPASETYGSDGIARERRRSFLHTIFRGISYSIFLGVLFGITYIFRTYLEFSYVSIGIFILFLSLVSFGALKTRNIATELIVVPMPGNILTPFVDMIGTPILGVGKALSEGVSKLSPIPFVMDNVVETPFKGFLRIFEEWNTYLKEEKEEIV